MWWERKGRVALLLGLVGICLGLAGAPTRAVDIELRDAAPYRIERQRAYGRGEAPFAGTPDLAKLDERLAEKGLARGNRVFVRIFKEESELELWLFDETSQAFVLFATYPICHWTGTLGPKIKEGDRQSPEGFYTVRWQQTRLVGRWRRAFNLGFPNAHDQLNGRTGSFLLVHGGCSSVGCYAMTEQVQDEIFSLVAESLTKTRDRFHVHVFPFRMTDANMERHKHHVWMDFWRDLKAGYDTFERSRLPPRVGICEKRYQVSDGAPDDNGDPDYLSTLRAPSPSAEPTIGYQPPRCALPGDRTRVARQTVASETDAETPQAAPQSKPARRARAVPAATNGGGTPPLKDEADGGLGARPAPGSPRILSGGG